MKVVDARSIRALFIIALTLFGTGVLGPKEVRSNAMSDNTTIRKPAVAGSFYPADPAQLHAQINDYLSRVTEAPAAGRVLALVSPHAGYIYSGQVAAHAYKLIQNQDIKTVIVISPSHVEFFPFASVFDGGGYQTPLGVIPIDHETVQRITRDQEVIKRSSRGHLQEQLSRQEHALEVQLPFLQCVLDDFSIVPIVMGDQNWKVCEALGKAIAPVLRQPGVIVIASSDLSHFHPDEEARRLDGVFCRHLEEMDMESLYSAVQKDATEACGAGPVIASVIAGSASGGEHCRILATATSADVSHETTSVVGYMAAAVIGEPVQGGTTSGDNRMKEFELTPKEKTYLLQLARHTIAQKLGIETTAPVTIASPLLDMESGAFVTLKIEGRLRGCIGYIEALRPMKTAIVEMAKAAAFSDPRFRPLTAEEFPAISLEISVLSPVQPVTDIEEIVVGRHGIIIEQGSNRGLLLPQVATEYGWDRQQFLEHTCQKAMLPANAWKEPDTKIFLFAAEVFGEDEMEKGE